ncbi:MAG TPA: ATP-binding protein [Actinomycetota bacterium]|nr:ATP-binding protein [Actinomycetota bacterium]
MRDGRSIESDEASLLEDIRGSEQTMAFVRWAGVVFAVLQILSYEQPYPAGVEGRALFLAGVLAAANLVISLFVLRDLSLRGARILSLSAMAVDFLVISGFVWLYAFDQLSALWAVMFVLPLEGAIRFGLAGALGVWVAMTISYGARELWGSSEYGYPFLWNSVSFRMGIGLLIALVAGMMARRLLHQRADLARALIDLRRVDAVRSRLVATLAHDVRNPLTTIRGTFSTLSRHEDVITPEARSELIASADRQAERLQRLSSELLDLARLELGRLDLQLQETALREVVDRGLSYADPERRFDVRVAPGLSVQADPARLEQIVVNLAMNALRYGKPPFVVEARDGADSEIDLLFVDHGPGIPRDQRPALFEPFRAEHDPSSIGLGLAIVRVLAEAHGGGVAYEPNEPNGARFRVWLPATSG